MRKLLLVGNPTAQSGRNLDRIERARALLRARGVVHELIPTKPDGGTIETIVARLREHDELLLASMGGDGTFAEVARALCASGRATDVPLAMLPTGTANDQGKSFGLEADDSALPRNIEVMLDGCETRLDAGRLQARDESGALLRTELFFDSAGWGISPRTLQLRNDDRETVAQIPILRDFYRDEIVYVGALLRTFLSSYVEEHKFDVDVEADGKEYTWKGLTDLIVKGTRIYGGLWIVDENARHDDGLFEVVPFAGKRDWISKSLVMLRGPAIDLSALSRLGLSHSEGFSAKKIRLRLRRRPGGAPLVGQLDGDVFQPSPTVAPDITIDVLPRALRLIVPRDLADKN